MQTLDLYAYQGCNSEIVNGLADVQFWYHYRQKGRMVLMFYREK